MKRGSRSALAAACVLLAVFAWGAPTASAEIVRTSNGHFFGITLHRGVAAASVPGSIAAQHRANFSLNGNLNYHGGPVAHSSAAYLVFWTPSGFSIPASSKTLLQRYFSDAAAASGTSSSVFAVNRQFTDGSGFAAYQQAFSSTQVITDTQAYPAFDPNRCAPLRFGEAQCISDAQVQTELQRLVSTGLPDDGPATSSTLPPNAPIYFVVLPSNVNVCDQQTSCADNVFCSYHSAFTNSNHRNVLYVPVPFLAAAQFPKQCQSDGNFAVQTPNGDLADVVLKYLSHEHNEVLTDPLGSAWFDSSSGNENGDNCNATGSANPQGGRSPNAFLPVLGGSASSGTLYDQLLAGNPYYVQSEWSNGDAGCQMAPTAGTIVPQFAAPTSGTDGVPVSFDPSASSSTNPLSSATWDFGDGATPTFRSSSSTLSSVSHTYTAPGTYTVKLTLVDDRGNLATTTHQIAVADEPPTAAFTIGVPQPTVGQSIPLDASASNDPDGSIASYAWTFGDGHTATGTTASQSHAYSQA
ncbi:MAG: PKD domain-containing protein, partial [Actinomycetota bacterium]|nr:PKD domain-containing protein [Actinomycetota bacterium]